MELEDVAPIIYVIPSMWLLFLTMRDPTYLPLAHDCLWGWATGMALYGFMYACGTDRRAFPRSLDTMHDLLLERDTVLR